MTDETRITLLAGCAELKTTYRIFKAAMNRRGITPKRGDTISNGGKPPTTISRDELVLVAAEINRVAFVDQREVDELFDHFTRYTGWQRNLAQRINVRTDALVSWFNGTRGMRRYNYDRLDQARQDVEDFYFGFNQRPAGQEDTNG